MNDRVFVVSGYGAAKLSAEASVGAVRPGGKRIDPYPSIRWEDASEEMRRDPKRMWISGMTGKKTFRRHTPEEKEEIRLNQKWRIEQITKTILEKYGWEYAERYVKENKEKIDKYEIKINLIIPHCQYESNNQCDLFCPYFRGKCIYTEE